MVRTDIAASLPPEAWQDLVPEHEKDLLQWASAHEVVAAATSQAAALWSEC